jgi:hypothetical protein
MRKKRRERTKKERSVSQSLGRKQPLPFIICHIKATWYSECGHDNAI